MFEALLKLYTQIDLVFGVPLTAARDALNTKSICGLNLIHFWNSTKLQSANKAATHTTRQAARLDKLSRRQANKEEVLKSSSAEGRDAHDKTECTTRQAQP